MKENFPNFPFIIRECEGAEPLILARYSKRVFLSLTGYGVEVKEFTEDLTEKEIESKIIQWLKHHLKAKENLLIRFIALVEQFVDYAEEVNDRVGE